MTLERDGTKRGVRITVAANSGNTEVGCLGVAVGNTVVGFFTEFSNPATTTTVTIFSSPMGVVYFSCSFGNSTNLGDSTDVTVRINVNSFNWVGTVTSTFNQ